MHPTVSDNRSRSDAMTRKDSCGYFHDHHFMNDETYRIEHQRSKGNDLRQAINNDHRT